MIRLFFIVLFYLLQEQALGQIIFCGNRSYPPVSFSLSTKEKLEAHLENAKTNYTKDTTNAEAIIWYGRRLAYLGLYDEAINIFTHGILLYPKDARMYRHRGHRYLTTRCIDKAINDFKVAVTLIKNKKDEIEPDGMPNDKNIPTSTLQSNIWYHLGLAYYLKKDFKNAEKAYKECLKVSKNPDMYVATANWYYITLREVKKNKEATKLLNTIQKGMPIIENEGYLSILLLYKGESDPEAAIKNILGTINNLANATMGFGIGNFYKLGGKKTKAREIFTKVTEGNQWGSFGFMAAESWLE